MRKDSQHIRKSANRPETREMGAFQMCGCLSAVIRAVLVTESLLTSVRGDGADSEEEREIKYALIGAGVGLLLAAGFIIVKVCIIRKHIRDNSRDDRIRKPSEPHLLTLSRFSQSEHPEAAVSNDMAMSEVKPRDLQDDVNPAKVASG